MAAGSVRMTVLWNVRALLDDLATVVAPDRMATGAPLASLTTMRVGGPADVIVSASSVEEITGVLSAARTHGVPVHVLAGGSNVLVADAGVRGLVLRVHGGPIMMDDEDHVRAGAGVTINGLVRWLVARGLAGLEAWAGTPGTVGGAIHGNAHFQGRLIGDHVGSVCLVQPSGAVANIARAEMGFGYDLSRLPATREVVLSARFRVTPGASPDAMRETARASLAFRKRTQPLHQPSAGCIFQNPGPDDPVPDGVPRSAGALIDRAGLKGLAIGSARVSALHGNFIVSAPGGTAADIRSVIERCKQAVAAQSDVRLREEIVYLGAWPANKNESEL